MNEVLQRITDLMDRKQIKDSVLCKEVGVSQSTFATWKQKDREPQLRYIPGIAKFLGVSIDYLLTGENQNDESYYFDREVVEMAQEMATRPELKVLFSASRNVSKESIEAINNMIKQMNKE